MRWQKEESQITQETQESKLDEQVSITHVLSKQSKQEIHIDPQSTKKKGKMIEFFVNL